MQGQGKQMTVAAYRNQPLQAKADMLLYMCCSEGACHAGYAELSPES